MTHYATHLPFGGADSHAHLDLKFAASEVPQLVARAEKAGLAHIGQVFLSPQAYTDSIDRLSAFQSLFFLLGIHPHEAEQCTPECLRVMHSCFTGDTRLKAMGEIGLDFFRNRSSVQAQEAAFAAQLQLAAQLRVPVVIHSRSAAPQSVAMLEAGGFAGRPVLWHCFSDADAIAQLERILANGWYISIPGTVTYPANKALREAIARIPVDRLLVETDCPYLAPQAFRGGRNEPALVVHTAQCVAECLGLDPADFWLQSGANCRLFFGLESI